MTERKGKNVRFYLTACAVLLLLMIGSLFVGRYGIPSGDARVDVLLHIRIPRILAASLVGMALSLAGAVFQTLFQNPMATPDLLGTSSGSCFGAALAMLVGLSRTGVVTFGFGFGLLSVLLCAIPARRMRRNRLVSLLLTGMVVGSLFSAGTSCIKLLADPDNKLPGITYWMMGSFSGVRLSEVLRNGSLIAVSAAVLLLLRFRLNALALSEEEAAGLGVRLKALRTTAVICATLLTAASVSLSGLIGWVGLFLPNLCRRLVGGDCRRLLPASMVTGAAFLLLLDDLARTLLTVEIPIGILTAFVGAPVFLMILFRREDGGV